MKRRLDFSKYTSYLNQNKIDILLILFVIFGLLCKLIISLNYRLQSDNAYVGMICLEIGKYHNFLLKNYSVFSMDSSLFNDILPFHLLPQILSNYDPKVMLITAYVIFVLMVLTFSYLLYKYSKSLTSALIFAALILNMDPVSYRTFFAQPSFHIGTILISGLFVVLFYNNGILKAKVNLKHAIKITLIVVIMCLISFSDGMFVAFFLIPFNIVYLFFEKGKTPSSNIAVVVIDVAQILTYFLVPSVVNKFDIIHIVTLPRYYYGIDRILGENVSYYLNGIVIVYNWAVYEAVNGIRSFGVLEWLVVLSTIVLFYFAGKNLISNKKTDADLFKWVFIISSLVILILYLIAFCYDLTTSRYLMFTILGIFTYIALPYDNKNKIYVIALSMLLITTCIMNFNAIKNIDFNANQNEYEVIAFLESKNLTYGYANYWDANIMTYLSQEQVTIRSVSISEDGIYPFKHLYNNSWYDYKPDQFFYMVNDQNNDKANISSDIIRKYPPIDVYHYNSYTIYKFNNNKILKQFN